MKEPGWAAQPSISGLTSKDSRLRVASTTATLCPIYYRNFLDAAHLISHSTSTMTELARRAYSFLRSTATLNSNLSQETSSQVYSKVDASIALQLHVKVSVKAQEDNSGYLDRSFHCMMTS